MSPTFPLTVVWDDGSIEVLQDIAEIETGLEWFDTDEIDGGPVTVTDAEGRPVRLKVEALELLTCELVETPPARTLTPALRRVAA